MDKIVEELESAADKEKISAATKFFKTGKGDYSEKDIFIGVKVPVQRTIAKKYFKGINLNEILNLLDSPIHEHRQTALMMLVLKFEKEKDEEARKEIYDFYLSNTKYVNNWDLVDGSARIIGRFVLDKDRKILYRLAASKVLWEQRIAIVATQELIRKNQIEDTLKISRILLPHKHDLIHKAVGWMLREAWQKQPKKIEAFIREHYKSLPRTTLRYTIEKFPPRQREQYLKGTFH